VRRQLSCTCFGAGLGIASQLVEEGLKKCSGVFDARSQAEVSFLEGAGASYSLYCAPGGVDRARVAPPGA